MKHDVLKTFCLVLLFLGGFTTSFATQAHLTEVEIISVDYAPNGSLIALSGIFGDFYGFVIINSQGEKLTEVKTERIITGVLWSPDSQYLAARHIHNYEKGEYGDTISIYKINDESPFIQEITHYQSTNPTSGYPMLWSPDGRYIIMYYGIGITIRDSLSGDIISSFITGDTGKDSIEDVAWHPITNELYVLDSRNGLRVYDPMTGKPTRDTLLLPLSEPQSTESNYLVASELAFNADGSELAIVFNDFYQTTRFIDPVSGKTLREFRPENPDFDIRTLHWSADDAMVMTVGAPSFAIRFWDAQTGRLLQSYDGLLGGYVRDFVVSPDMTQMVVIGGYPQSAGQPAAAPLQDGQGLTLESGHALLLNLNTGRVASD